MQTNMHTSWTSFTLAQNGANPVFNQANPGTGAPAASTPGATGAPGTAPATGTGAAAPGNPFGFMLPLILVLGGIIALQIFTTRKQEKKRRELLNSVKKYDKVVTAGGIVGTVVEIRDDEVVLKVDDHSPTKIRFARWAVQQVVRPQGETGKTDEADETKSKGESVGAKS